MKGTLRASTQYQGGKRRKKPRFLDISFGGRQKIPEKLMIMIMLV